MDNSSNTGTGSASNKPERPSTGASARVASGVWGGEHVRLNVRADGASIEYDCANGTIDEPLDLDAGGRFDAKGTHVREGPGPIRVGKLPPVVRRVTRRVGGDEMSLTLTLTDTSQESARTRSRGGVKASSESVVDVCRFGERRRPRSRAAADLFRRIELTFKWRADTLHGNQGLQGLFRIEGIENPTCKCFTRPALAEGACLRLRAWGRRSRQI